MDSNPLEITMENTVEETVAQDDAPTMSAGTTIEDPIETPPVGDMTGLKRFGNLYGSGKRKVASNSYNSYGSEDDASPPKRGPGRPRGTGRTSSKKPTVNIRESVTDLMVYGGMTLHGVGTNKDMPRLAFDGQVLLAKSDDVGKTISDIADKNPFIKRSLERLIGAGGMASIGAVCASLAIPILANHGMLPNWLGAMLIPQGVDGSLFTAKSAREVEREMNMANAADGGGTYNPEDLDGTVYQTGPIPDHGEYVAANGWPDGVPDVNIEGAPLFGPSGE
jgi:hypothetical protein